ncbi:rhodanese-like domain-containing protein [Brenneria populi subsp. brevivirga]|uniref:rhodanese-like domain-containing protein n=1 Tax=Brenneria populi TaxID=1505588 RepID=UPI002E19D5B4|nr:rhodanese-like domain-containing protein [Brenneria populi subsp. brevivirga]
MPISPSPQLQLPRLTPQQLLEELNTATEIALLDVREQGLYTQGHLLLAVNAPLWRLGLLIGDLVPRRFTRIVLTDEDGSLLEEAADRLNRLGYHNLALLSGGTQAWLNAGLEIFIDENVPSKALGEFIEIKAHTPNISVEELRRQQAKGEKLVIVDGRTPEEFANFSLPGAHNIPNGELPYRIRELAPDPQTLVVVNCAGRTRSIIGAQTLIDAELPNRVVALTNGTMAWLLAKQPLDQGRQTTLPHPSAENLRAAREQARQLTLQAGIATLDARALADLRADPNRTLYQFDTRTHDEYQAGHLPGFRWAPGGQLVQATDRFVATQGARIVLANWDGVRAGHTAVWLQRLGGFELFLYEPTPDEKRVTGPSTPHILRDSTLAPPTEISPQQLNRLLEQQAAQVIDIDNSLRFIRQHIIGARFIAPHRLTEWLPKLADERRQWVLTSRDGVLANLVAGELQRHAIGSITLAGGNQAWFAAGLPTESGDDAVLTAEEDQRLSGYNISDPARRDRLFRDYLDWETGLVQQLERPGGELRFNL